VYRFSLPTYDPRRRRKWSSPPVAISSALPGDVNMDLTMCGLLVERAEELARLYAEHGNWNDVKERWFDERLSNRSTRGSSQKIYRVLTSRFKNAPTDLPGTQAFCQRYSTSARQRAIKHRYFTSILSPTTRLFGTSFTNIWPASQMVTQIHWTSRTRRLSISSLTSSILTAAPSTMRIRRLSGGARAFDQ